MAEPAPRPGNLRPAGRRQRLVLGVLAALGAVGMGIWIALTDPPLPGPYPALSYQPPTLPGPVKGV